MGIVTGILVVLAATMPIINVFGWSMLTMDFSYSEKYWPLVTEIVNKKFGEAEIKEAKFVQETLKECFQFLGDKFMALINEQKKASFYIYVHNFHENSIEIWKEQLKGRKLTMNESDFALIRRVLKIILEQGCENDLISCLSFEDEISDNILEYEKYLNELIYVGYQAIIISDYIARSQLCSKAIGFQVRENNLNIFPYSPYDSIFEYIEKDIPKHNDSVELDDTFKALQNIWKNDLGMNFNVLGSLIMEQDENPSYRFSVIKYNILVEKIIQHYKFEKPIIEDFLSGLTVSKSNKLSFEDCILRSQDIRRHLYRPIVKFNIDDKDFCLIGMNKCHESFMSLANTLPFGICPTEWKKYPVIAKFIVHLQNTHDEILENPAIDLLKKKNVKFDKKIKSIRTKKGNNINIIKKDIGEIDLVFLDEHLRFIYICECKHNRSRYDWFNWRRDYANFKGSYEKQLKNKVAWANDNKMLLLEHFEIIFETTIENKDEFITQGIFLINAPTIYMYNCIYPTLTLHNLEELLNDRYKQIIFSYTDQFGNVHSIEQPYFQNIDKL